MNFIEYYLGQNQDRRIIYYLGARCECSSLVNTLNMCVLEDFYLVLEDDFYKEFCLKELSSKVGKATFDSIHFVSLDETKEILSRDSHFTIVYDSAFVLSTLVELSKYKPNRIIGCFDKDFSTFDLWEKLRDYADEIVLATKVTEYKVDVLSWKRNPETDIELSVILPVYNVAKYLDKCIATISEWKAPYVEFVFVNDGSPDNSAEIIKEYAKKDKRIKLLNKVNGGCASAREYGMANTKGRYIGFVDPDDFVDPTMFKKLLSNALRGMYDISYCKYLEYYEDTGLSKEVEDLTDIAYEYGTTEVSFIDNLIAYLRVAIWRCIYKREFIESNKLHFYVDLKRFDDLPFKVETFARAKSVICQEEPLYYYRLGREGQDVSVHDERLYVHFDIFKHLDEFFKTPRRSEQLLLYYQVKIQTHYWGFMNLDKQYEKEYLSRAAKDLNIKNNKHSWKKVIKQYYRKPEVKAFLKKMR